MDTNDFAQRVKNKYPQYASIPNDQLTQKVIQKYPQYASLVQQPQQPQQQAPQQPGMPGQNQPSGNPGQLSPELQALAFKAFPELLQKQLAGRMGENPRQASPWRIVPGMIGEGGKPLQQNEQTGEVRYAEIGATPTGRGNAAFNSQSGGGTGINLRSPTDPSKTHLNEARATTQELSGINMLEKNIDPSTATRTSPVGAAASSVRRVKNGLSLLSMPTVSNAALQAVMGDIDSIVTQGAATVEGRKALQGSNIFADIQNFKSKVSSHPENTPIPAGVANLYRNILNDLGPISEAFVQDRVNQQGELYRSRGEQLVGKDKYDGMLKRIKSGFTIKDQPAKSATNSDLSSMSDDELRRIAAGGQ